MRLTLVLLAGLLAVLLPAARLPAQPQPLPELGDAAGAALPPQLERRIGESIVREIREREPAYIDDAEVASYVDGLGRRLLGVVPGARQDFEFFVMRDATINAFALPGGFIGVHTGLLTTAESESEVASVLAHEIAHVTQRHIARMIGNQQQMQLPTMIALAAAILIGRSRRTLPPAPQPPRRLAPCSSSWATRAISSARPTASVSRPWGWPASTCMPCRRSSRRCSARRASSTTARCRATCARTR
jgi:Zn-dependent protease with chaperone function